MTDMVVEQSLTGGTRVKRQNISKAKATIRSHRGGKDRPVLSYRLISKGMFNKLSDNDISEIYRVPIHKIILDLTLNGVDYHNILIGLNQGYITKVYNLMLNLGLIDVNNKVTKLGSFVNNLPYGIRQGVILFRWLEQYPNKANAILPILSMIDVFDKPFWVYPMISPGMPQIEYKLLLLDHYKKYFTPFKGESDVHTFVKLWRILQDEIGVNPTTEDLIDWTTDNSINFDNMETVMILNNTIGNPLNNKLDLNILDKLGPIIKDVYSDKKLINDTNADRIIYLDINNNRYNIDSRYGVNSISQQQPQLIYGLVTTNINTKYANSFGTVALSLI